MIFKYLLTLLLLFIAPHESALAPVMDDDDTTECSDEWYNDGEQNFYTWETCLFTYSGTYESDVKLSREDHQELFEQVWSDHMGETDPPRLRRGKRAVEEVCEPDDDGEYPWGCFHYSTEWCGPWLTCPVPETVAVRDRSRRVLLHETAHAIHRTATWHPFWGPAAWGANLGSDGHTIGFRCLLLDIYRHYTPDVADDAYEMLHAVCVANGWTLPA